MARVAVMRGDGIGPEVVDAMLSVLRECGTGMDIVMCEAGSEQWEKNSRRDATYIPDATMAELERADACFKGPTTTLPVPGAPRSVAVTLRQKFDLYANIRPCSTYERLTPGRRLECACFREATEGLYSGVESQVGPDAAIAIRKVTRRGCARLADAAMEWAADRGMKRAVAITKRNILKRTDGIFWEEAQRAAGARGIGVSEIYIDNMAQQLVVAPEQFDGTVLLSTNLFMDIISELVSGLVGSIGLIHSANMGDSYAMFEAAHGSAPDIVGQGRANPAASILSGAWMAERAGEADIGGAIREATARVINEGRAVTADIGGSAGTSQMAAAIAAGASAALRR
ncbi:MAG: isocitrate/isopropylmalate family dehydrogenase [Thaumarchaeota archaeon]|nr:isocitrate/isopropylmalate family dehydrogenase [Nitrososphaerota archaeon]